MISPLNKQRTHTIIISDLHLGSKVSQPAKAWEMLQGYSFKKLILLGDIFDNLDFRDLPPEAWKLLLYIGKIAQKKKVRWIIGNHDERFYEIFRYLLNAKIYKTYSWHYKDKKYLAIHGHQFDRFLINNAWLSDWANKIYNLIQRLDTEDKKISHYLKRTSKGWLRLSEKVATSAIIFGQQNKADYIFCGHTHKSLQKTKPDIRYFNSGCWTDAPCSYITVDGDDIKIHNY